MELLVRFHGEPCGRLRIRDERMQFQYEPEWITAAGPPLSVSMPLRDAPWPDRNTFPFFENLLPEGVLRDLIAEQLGTAPNNFARLLSATGGDVAGAISLEDTDASASGHPPEREPHMPTEPGQAEALTETSLGQVIETLQHYPLLQGSDSGLRLSLAGAQRKLPVWLDTKKELYLPHHQPSTHILKPPAERFPGLVGNEYLCMRAARQAGLNVPDVSLRPFVDRKGLHHDAYLVSRYDRVTRQGQTTRLHQEDLCQVLGIPSARKYTADGGPGFGDVIRVLRSHTRPSAVHLREMIRRLLFNLMIGNQDAHAKNISLLHQASGQVALAPAYDIVSTLVYDQLTDRLAMPVGSAGRIRELDRQAMERFEEETGIHLRRQAGTLHRFVDTALLAVEDQARQVSEQTWPGQTRVLDRIVAISQRHAALLHDWLG